jgi:TRAP-type C4-dicarboxylate transport system permease small subunit
VRATINLVRPDWVRLRAIYGVIVHCGGLAVVYFLIKGPSWVVASDSAAGEYTHTAEIVNQILYYSLVATGFLSTVILVVRIARLIRGTRRRAARSPSVGALPREGN